MGLWDTFQMFPLPPWFVLHPPELNPLTTFFGFFPMGAPSQRHRKMGSSLLAAFPLKVIDSSRPHLPSLSKTLWGSGNCSLLHTQVSNGKLPKVFSSGSLQQRSVPQWALRRPRENEMCFLLGHYMRQCRKNKTMLTYSRRWNDRIRLEATISTST